MRLRRAGLNRSIAAIWSTIYRGEYLDGISVAPPAPPLPQPAAPHLQGDMDSERHGPYQLVMRKREKTLEMQGRCSVLTRRLAALVVRFALAEVFGIEGTLELIDPTKDLDPSNVDRLAQALTALMGARQKMPASGVLRLCIITHDELLVQRIDRPRSVEARQVPHREAPLRDRTACWVSRMTETTQYRVTI